MASGTLRRMCRRLKPLQLGVRACRQQLCSVSRAAASPRVLVVGQLGCAVTRLPLTSVSSPSYLEPLCLPRSADRYQQCPLSSSDSTDCCHVSNSKNSPTLSSDRESRDSRLSLNTMDRSSPPPEELTVCWCPNDCFNKIPLLSPVINQITSKLGESPHFLASFTAQSTDIGRIKLALSEPVICDAIRRHFAECSTAIAKTCGCGVRHQKVPSAAQFHRKQGNDGFKEKQYINAVVDFTRALMFAPLDIEDAPFAYGNRSAAYYYMKQYQNALEDIESALTLGYSRYKQVTKLLLRKAECLLALGRVDEAVELLNSDIKGKPDPNTNEGKRWTQLVKLCNIKDRKVHEHAVKLDVLQDPLMVVKDLIAKGRYRPQEKFPWLSTKVELRYDEFKGRHLIALENLEFGEVIGVAKPFVNLVPPDIEAKYERCHHCLCSFYLTCHPNNLSGCMTLKVQGITTGPGRISNPVPCEKCANAIYCSPGCRAKAWTTYHRRECSQLALLFRSDEVPHLAIRMLYATGGLNKARAAVKRATELQSPLEGLECPVNYSQVYRTTHERDEGVNQEEMLRLTVTACWLLRLAKMSGFVKENLQDEYFAGSLLLRHLCQLQLNFNFTHKTKLYQTPVPSEADMDPVRMVAPMISLLNHSCDPNVLFIPVSSTDIIQSDVLFGVTLNPVFAGTELTMRYGQKHALPRNCSVSERQEYLRKEFGFICVCSRCEIERRDAAEPDGTYYPIGCDKCRSLVTRTSFMSEIFQCSSPECGHQVSLAEIRSRYTTLKLLGEKMDHLTERIDEIFKAKQTKDLLAAKEANKMVTQLGLLTEQTSSLFCLGAMEVDERYIELSRFYGQLAGRTDKDLKRYEGCLRSSWECFEKNLATREHRYGVDSKQAQEVILWATKNFAPIIQMLNKWDGRHGLGDVVVRYNELSKQLYFIGAKLSFDDMCDPFSDHKCDAVMVFNPYKPKR